MTLDERRELYDEVIPSLIVSRDGMGGWFVELIDGESVACMSPAEVVAAIAGVQKLVGRLNINFENLDPLPLLAATNLSVENNRLAFEEGQRSVDEGGCWQVIDLEYNQPCSPVITDNAHAYAWMQERFGQQPLITDPEDPSIDELAVKVGWSDGTQTHFAYSLRRIRRPVKEDTRS
jgi:hypothetical protein